MVKVKLFRQGYCTVEEILRDFLQFKFTAGLEIA